MATMTEEPKQDENEFHFEEVSEKKPVELSFTPTDEILNSLENTQNVQKIVREGVLLATGAAAILLQVAMPGVAKGVDNHSSFAYRPLDRLRTTLTYVYCMAFGTKQEKKFIIEMVNRAHSTVRGPGYSADDVELQMWVAATLYASGIFMYEEVYGAIEPSKADKIYDEYSILAVSLRVPRERWPKDRKAFWTYWHKTIEKLEITDHARTIANDLLYNQHLFLPLRLGLLPIVRIMTAQMLPERIREGYGLKSGRLRRTTYKTIILGAKIAYPVIPKFVRTLPVKYYMRDMRKRMRNMV